MKRSIHAAALMIILCFPGISREPDVQSVLSLTLTPAVVVRSTPWYTEGAESRPDFLPFYSYESIPSLFELDWTTEAGPFFTRLNIPVRKSFLAAQPDTAAGTNLVTEWFMDADMTFPFRGSIGYGTDRVGLKLSRDSLRIGNGEWSSMTINARAPYFDYLQGYYDIGFFRATETLISLNPYLFSEERTRQDEDSFFHTWDPKAYRERVKTAAVHELSFNLGPLDLGIGEIIIIGGRSLQLQDLNPFLVYHNFYGEDWGNLIAFLNAAYTPVPGLRFYTDIAVDDLTAPTEAEDNTAPPPALGALAGVSWEWNSPRGAGIRAAAEGAYVSPTFGFRDKPLQGPYSRIMYLDNTAGGKRAWVDYPLNYYLGNDLLDLRTRLSFFIPFTDTNSLSGYVGAHMLVKGEETLHGRLSDEGVGIHTGNLPRGVAEVTKSVEGSLVLSAGRGFSGGVTGAVSLVENAGHAEGKDAVEWAVDVFISSELRIGTER